MSDPQVLGEDGNVRLRCPHEATCTGRRAREGSTPQSNPDTHGGEEAQRQRPGAESSVRCPPPEETSSRESEIGVVHSIPMQRGNAPTARVSTEAPNGGRSTAEAWRGELCEVASIGEDEQPGGSRCNRLRLTASLHKSTMNRQSPPDCRICRASSPHPEVTPGKCIFNIVPPRARRTPEVRLKERQEDT